MSRKRGNGEGSITKRKDGRWMARYTVQTAKGAKRKHIYGRTRQEVAEKLSKAVSDRVGGLVFEGDHETREKLDARLSPRTVQIIHTVLRKALQQAVRDDVLPRNVCNAVTAPR